MTALHRPISRRTLLGGLAGGAVLAGAAGCSGGSGSQDQPAPVPTDGKVIGRTDLEIFAWSNGPTIDANFKKRVDLFNQDHQGKFTAKINFLPYDQYWQKVQLQYAANKPFDIYYWDVQAYAHYKKGLVFDEQPVIDTTAMMDAAKYPTNLYDPWKFDGKNLYCIPENIQSTALFYNKDHFDEAGLDYPDATWTWDKVVEVAPQLQKSSGGKVTRWGLDIGTLGIWWGIQTLAWATGTAFVDKPLEPTAFQMTDPKVVESMKFVQDLMWAQHIAPRPEERADVAANNGGFASGAYSMVPGATWDIASYNQMKAKWAMAPMPTYQGQRVAPYWLGGWVIPKKSGALTAAQTFALWSATTFQKQMAKDHDWIPIENAARDSSDMLSGMPDGFAETMKALPQARIGDIYTTNMQQIFNEVFGPNFDQMFNNKLTPQAAAQKMQDAATKLISN
ncbi:multiple sugar transport system substrate-binding protein [Friedmanniella endophytica]|uniref:Multiple sugar transport system substrate-binding protein n=1 Tax=Microlunatus kandeliicorticis TaxID=1759536 RepID=A0A7W3IUB4_9ACTN|nr:extracellular solute-binding protein [Microlunatus kandeliicorticis]MBA8795379.1 multiple sugar transport system substrate-binding protein [Microlunatus kandeliicorticis]